MSDINHSGELARPSCAMPRLAAAGCNVVVCSGIDTGNQWDINKLRVRTYVAVRTMRGVRSWQPLLVIAVMHRIAYTNERLK